MTIIGIIRMSKFISNSCNRSNSSISLNWPKLVQKQLSLIRNIKDPKLLTYLEKYRLILHWHLMQLFINNNSNLLFKISIKITIIITIIIMSMINCSKNCFIWSKKMKIIFRIRREKILKLLKNKKNNHLKKITIINNSKQSNKIKLRITWI